MTKGEALKKMQAVKAYMTSGNPIWDVTEIGEAFGMAIEALEQPERRWIPCSERLPSEGMEVLLTDTVWNMVIGRLIRTDEGYKWDVGEWWNDLEDWTAWMPLPECYKGE